MALRQINTDGLAELAVQHSALGPRAAGDAVRAVCDVIAELGDEVRILDAGAAKGSGNGVVAHRVKLDPADPPKLDGDAIAIFDEGVIGLNLLRRA
jgi:hypothetical protein